MPVFVGRSIVDNDHDHLINQSICGRNHTIKCISVIVCICGVCNERKK